MALTDGRGKRAVQRFGSKITRRDGSISEKGPRPAPTGKDWGRRLKLAGVNEAVRVPRILEA
jgi:hypothetical protein